MNIKKLLGISCGVVVLGAGGVGGFAALQPARTPENLMFGDLNIGGLTKEELQGKLAAWWESEKTRKFQLRSSSLDAQPPDLKLAELGVKPDFDATIGAAPFQTSIGKWLGGGKASNFGIKWTLEKNFRNETLAEFVIQHSPTPGPAKVQYSNGRVIVKHEITKVWLDVEKFGAEILAALNRGDSQLEIPLKYGPRKISDQQLDQITDVVSEFTTNFNSGQTSRSGNIRIAAQKLNGTILLPGETLSYNKVVGPRVSDEGYKMAPVYVSGRHEMGFGGGICQTVTTLFNAALLANLEIVQRQNHSMPVRYVPLGRDATASYGSIDLVFKNTRDTPIAISSEVNGGTLTFRILGKSDPSTSIQIVVTGLSSWGHSVKVVDDPNLAPGATQVVEKGSEGHSCTTWRIVKKDGIEIKREKVATSYYTAFPAIVHRGPAAPTVPVKSSDAGDDSGLMPPPANPKPNGG